MRKYKRIASIFVAATLTASLFAGCQKSPEKEIVSNKDMDNMIDAVVNNRGCGGCQGL